ncbi:MAG: class I SAM-dependent methyltransferase [Deltaproteobacteria bacterium]|nr:class I SAM-dependent methyltransferase [Deltaproteobacteria bacterium]
MTTHPDTLFKHTFGHVQRHRLVGDIIRKFSDNRSDVYEMALKGLDFNQPIRILDIGCGYGRFTGHLKQLVPAGSRCTGLDLLTENRQPFLDTARKIDPEADFIAGPADQIEEIADNSYELIIIAYSLNFFSTIIPDLARILAPDGQVVIINHTRHFLKELVQDIILALSNSAIAGQARLNHEQLISDFNDENGSSFLTSHFKTVEYIDYPNQLSFSPGELDRFFIYLDFKLPMLVQTNQSETDADLTRFKEILFKRIRQGSQVSGVYRLNKDDCIFRCRQPVKGDVPDVRKT